MSLFGNYGVFRICGNLYIAEVVDNARVRLWRRTGKTTNPRVIALAGGAMIGETMHTVHIEDGLVLLQHWNGGIMHRFAPAEQAPTTVTFERVGQEVPDVEIPAGKPMRGVRP